MHYRDTNNPREIEKQRKKDRVKTKKMRKMNTSYQVSVNDSLIADSSLKKENQQEWNSSQGVPKNLNKSRKRSREPKEQTNKKITKNISYNDLSQQNIKKVNQIVALSVNHGNDSPKNDNFSARSRVDTIVRSNRYLQSDYSDNSKKMKKLQKGITPSSKSIKVADIKTNYKYRQVPHKDPNGHPNSAKLRRKNKGDTCNSFGTEGSRMNLSPSKMSNGVMTTADFIKKGFDNRSVHQLKSSRGKRKQITGVAFRNSPTIPQRPGTLNGNRFRHRHSIFSLHSKQRLRQKKNTHIHSEAPDDQKTEEISHAQAILNLASKVLGREKVFGKEEGTDDQMKAQSGFGKKKFLMESNLEQIKEEKNKRDSKEKNMIDGLRQPEQFDFTKNLSSSGITSSSQSSSENSSAFPTEQIKTKGTVAIPRTNSPAMIKLMKMKPMRLTSCHGSMSGHNFLLDSNPDQRKIQSGAYFVEREDTLKRGRSCGKYN